MDEQLTMFEQEGSFRPSKDEKLQANLDNLQDDDYDALDYQLANLLVELNDFKPTDEEHKKTLDKTLRYITLEISKRTLEGQISIEISVEQKTTLLQTTVVGEPGEYMPLIIDTLDDAIYLYLNRYWQYQQRLADQINKRIESKESLTEEQKTWAQARLTDYFPSDEYNNDNEINWQKRAAELALENRFLVISGGPGTGKTTTITRLLALLIEQKLMLNQGDAIDTNTKPDAVNPTSAENTDIITRHSPHPKGPAEAVVSQSSAELSVSKDETVSSLKKMAKRGGDVFSTGDKILLAAPTGKAAIRMLDSIREVTKALQTDLGLDEKISAQMPTKATTIQKLLGYRHHSTQFKYNKNNTLNADLVLVDEASMIDIALMTKLIEAVPEQAKLILIGDKDQLSAVETGSVFADICNALKTSDKLVRLTKNWRFSSDSDIAQCAIAANHGDSNTLLSVLNDPTRVNATLMQPQKLRDADLIKPWQHYFAVLNNPQSSLSEIFAAFNQYRILNALRRGYNGSETMNSRIETALEKQGLIQRRRSAGHQQSIWYHGRPVMITQNDYNRGLFNGDTGITLMRDGDIKVFFPTAVDAEGADADQFKAFSPVRLPAHETTWAMTIHKSQGSEFDRVVLILPHEEMPLLTRQLIYTGITRAKQQVSIIASENVLVSGIKAEVLKATNIDQHLKIT